MDFPLGVNLYMTSSSSNESTDKRFKITYCTECGYRDKADKLATELETALKVGCQIQPAEGGVFEVEDKGVLIFSKKATGRMPEDGEVLKIVQGVADGLSLEEAQSVAGPPASAVLEWIFGLFRSPSDTK